MGETLGKTPDDVMAIAKHHSDLWLPPREVTLAAITEFSLDDLAETVTIAIAGAIAAERDRCADVCRRIGAAGGDDGYYNIATRCADTILGLEEMPRE